jgi:hypothetical protein
MQTTVPDISGDSIYEKLKTKYLVTMNTEALGTELPPPFLTLCLYIYFQ